jgi:hypothetical protein
MRGALGFSPGFAGGCIALLVSALAVGSLHVRASGVTDGRAVLRARDLQPGHALVLTGRWHYVPGYALGADAHPETILPGGAVSVPVPQLLNRIRWWLDDSEQFDRREAERLRALGFDTDRAEDGWYYLQCVLPELPSSRHLFVEFEGVAMRSRTFCNGQFLGAHDGMFSRFAYDLTPHLRAGTNLLAVYVSMERIPEAALPMGRAVTVNLTASKVKTMSKGMFGPLSPGHDNRAYDLHGIWQPVRLVVRGAGRLEDVWFVPGLTNGEVRVDARALAEPLRARLEARWTDVATGELLAALRSGEFALGRKPVSQVLRLENVRPRLWTPAAPHLYRLEVTLRSVKGELLDTWARNVGFRTFEVRGNRFYLNGRPWWLRGANHLPYGKNPFDPELPRKLIRLLHDANMRVTRTHGTPWNEAWLDAADEIGLGVSLEGVRPWALAGRVGPTPPELFEHWLGENEDVIKRARNHPSVLLYTVGNEMLLGDAQNLDKWRQLSEVVRQTRRLDPTRPVVCSSDYARDPEFYRTVLQPAAIDDGDVDDLHRYNNWYAPSTFVTSARLEREVQRNGGARPLIGQEMSTGYPDLDRGLPVRRYTRDLWVPQAWVGAHAEPGSDPAIFLEHHRAVTKRWAECLRFERGTNTAGFLLFATECWFAHSYDAARLRPYPVVEAVRDAWAPVGVALETGRRRFFAGETIETAVFVTNDDEHFRDLADLDLELVVTTAPAPPPSRAKTLVRVKLARLSTLPYYETARVPVKFQLPEIHAPRIRALLELRLSRAGQPVSRSGDRIELFERPKSPARLASTAAVLGLEPNLQSLAAEMFINTATNLDALPADGVLLIGPAGPVEDLRPGGALARRVQSGATAVVFKPPPAFTNLFPEAIASVREFVAEFVDFTPCVGTPLAAALEPMDLKWWGRRNDWRLFVASRAHQLKPGGPARELIRYIPPHGYIPKQRIPDQLWTVLSEIPLGSGRIWICDLDLEETVKVDPAARRFAENLLRATTSPGF